MIRNLSRAKPLAATKAVQPHSGTRVGQVGPKVAKTPLGSRGAGPVLNSRGSNIGSMENLSQIVVLWGAGSTQLEALGF